ncbi:MAG TPA: dockerin type I domain-containing protein, partial [Bacteroidales bacterium]|nr:dockerin type I domain-containing protein [Bacteroidales bacterium]
TSPPGNYALSLRNAIVGNQQSQNILHSTLDGTVAINQSPVVTVSSDITICYGDSVPIGANGAAAYTWDQGLGSGSSHTVAPVTSTIFSVTGTNANGCTGTNEVSVLIYPEPDQSSAGADALNIADSIYFLQANLPNIGVGVWKIVSGQGGYLADSLNPNSAFSGLTDTLYLLEWKISGICSSTSDSVLISFAEPPQYARIDVSVRYANNASTPLTGVEVVLSGDSLTRTGLTDTNGNISFDSLPLGDYYITASHTGAWISGASNSVDALAIMQHYVHLISLSGIYLQCAADVNASGFINATDALQVAQRFTGLVQAFGAGDWCFSPGNIDLLNPENYSVVIQGVMVGDVNGSYVPPQSK